MSKADRLPRLAPQEKLRAPRKWTPPPLRIYDVVEIVALGFVIVALVAGVSHVLNLFTS